MRIGRLLTLLPALFLLCETELMCQVNWMSPLKRDGFTIEGSVLSLQHDTYERFPSGVYSFSGRVAVSDRLHFCFEVPLAYRSFSGFISINDADWGNPYFGLEFAQERSTPIIRIGARIPAGDNDSRRTREVGKLAAAERVEAFEMHSHTLLFQAGYRYLTGGGIFLQGVGGPIIEFPRGYSSTMSLELGTEVGYENRESGVSVGYHVRSRISEETLVRDYSLRHELGVAAWFIFNRISPAFHVKYPLNSEIRDEVKLIYGLNLTVFLPDSGTSGK